MGRTNAISLPLGGGFAAAAGDGEGFALARRLQAPVWVFDIDLGRVVLANDAACEFWQAVDEQDLRTRDMAAEMSQAVSQRLRQYQQDFTHSDPVFNEMWTLYPGGKPSSVMVYFSGYTLDDGRMGMLCEVSARSDDQPENLRSTEALLHTDVMIGLYDMASGGPLYLNPAARNILTESSHHLQDIFLNQADFAAMMIALQAGGLHGFVARTSTSEGERWHDISAKLCLDAVTGEQAILITAVDVSELKIARDTARYLADRDQLTGCFNRTFLQNHMADLQAANDGSLCTLIYLDVDRFKLINDIHGHEAGDTVLKTIATRALGVIRTGDILVRLGGDEFVIVLHQQSGKRDVLADVERIRKEISKAVWLNASKVDIAMSMGVTQFDPSQAVFADVIRNADLALYAAKSQGRGRSVMFDDRMGEAARVRDKIELDLRAALGTQQFTLEYQPRFDLRLGRVVSVEGLLRWHHPENGLIMPDRFIPICEETGMIEELGRQVLEIGCEKAREWHETQTDCMVSLNISPRQFADEQLVKTLQHFANQSGFSASQVELEVTENVLIGNPDEIAEKLRRITQMGYQIAIDDFGTGFSNLSYISRFPVHCIKIDRTFVDQLPSSAPIVLLILTLARQIGACSVAEGVETHAQLDWLIENGCDQVQGYLISRPVAPRKLDSVITLLDQGMV